MLYFFVGHMLYSSLCYSFRPLTSVKYGRFQYIPNIFPVCFKNGLCLSVYVFSTQLFFSSSAGS